ncbi:hypothetical protein chiPu_0030972 [Chiloscyllium punctatum]|uniref:Uncharacterized protein n=1 Tax=Chiloscyllium punctatum TaxID=137246 RepID=A0A401TVD6_CHIPU|nr:hypothetical protein [Chiloscyllium punctatum]
MPPAPPTSPHLAPPRPSCLGAYQSRGLTLRWLYSARGDFLRAAERLNNLISTSAVDNEALNRMYNDKIMRVSVRLGYAYPKGVCNGSSVMGQPLTTPSILSQQQSDCQGVRRSLLKPIAEGD